ncbi:hypothetical protein GQ457_18G009270 [Hibiscus cannabinus]
MADSLLSKLGELTFTAEEQDAVVVTPDDVAIPAEDFACSLGISEISLNFFLIAFGSPANRTNVLKRGPWDFQKYWFALEQADLNGTIHDYSFQHMCIWVRIHNIPLSLMTAALARALGASVGLMPRLLCAHCSMNVYHFFAMGAASLATLSLLVQLPQRWKGKSSNMVHGCVPPCQSVWPRGRLSIVGDDTDAPEMVDSASEGPSVHPNSTRAAAPASDPVVPVVAAPATRTHPAPRLMMPPWTRMPRKRLLIARLPTMLDNNVEHKDSEYVKVDYQPREGGKIVKVKDLKPKRIKGYLEYKFSQRNLIPSRDFLPRQDPFPSIKEVEALTVDPEAAID